MVQSIPSSVAPGRPRTRLKLRTRLRILARSGVRNSDIGLVVVAALIGGGVGLVVAFVQRIVRELHHVLFGIEFDSHLSDRVTIDARRIVAALVLGGLAYGVIAYLVRRLRPTEIVDAIEANALYGGAMSLDHTTPPPPPPKPPAPGGAPGRGP